MINNTAYTARIYKPNQHSVKLQTNYGGISKSQYNKSILTPSHCKEFFIEHLKPFLVQVQLERGSDSKFLDLTCGHAPWLEHLMKDPDLYEELRPNYLGIDICKNEIIEARSKYRGYNFEVADLRELVSKPKYDAIILINGAQCFLPWEIIRYAYGSLKKGGRMLVNFRSADHPENDQFFNEVFAVEGTKRSFDKLEYGWKTFKIGVIDFSERKDATKCAGKHCYSLKSSDMDDYLFYMGFDFGEKQFLFSPPSLPPSLYEVYHLTKR